MSSLLEMLRDQSFWYTPHGKDRLMRHSVAEMAVKVVISS